MANYRLVLEYDGTNYVGWQNQLNGVSVQAVLEKGIEQILQLPVSTVAAGRTDSGVHARGQVVSFRADKSVNTEVLAKSLNGLMPPDIVVLLCESAPEDFNAA